MDDSLITFLRERLDEREARAKAASRFHPTPWRLDPAVETTMETGRWVAAANDEGVLVANGDAPARFFADNDPAFVLADVEAKRRIIEAHQSLWRSGRAPEHIGPACKTCSSQVEGWPCTTLRLLALPYAGHPSFREEWRP